MRQFSSVLKVLSKYGTVYVEPEGYILHRGEYPLLTDKPSNSIVHFDGQKFHCPRSKQSYDPPVIIVSICGVSYIEHGSLSRARTLGGLIVWIGHEASEMVDLDIVISRNLGSE